MIYYVRKKTSKQLIVRYPNVKKLSAAAQTRHIEHGGKQWSLSYCNFSDRGMIAEYVAGGGKVLGRNFRKDFS